MTVFEELNTIIKRTKTARIILQGILAGLYVLFVGIIAFLLYFVLTEIYKAVFYRNLDLYQVLWDFSDAFQTIISYILVLALFLASYGALIAVIHKGCSIKGWNFEARFGPTLRPYSSALIISTIMGPILTFLYTSVLLPQLTFFTTITAPLLGFLLYLAWEKRFYIIVMHMYKRKLRKSSKNSSTIEL